MKPHLMLIGASLVAGATSAVSLAAHADQHDEQAQACRSDAFKFCSADIPNEDKITACMKQHIKELSPQCRAMFGKKKTS